MQSGQSSVLFTLGLLRPIYRQTASHRHGRPDLDLPWENTHHADALMSAALPDRKERLPA